jgi:hypothetical protein
MKTSPTEDDDFVTHLPNAFVSLSQDLRNCHTRSRTRWSNRHSQKHTVVGTEEFNTRGGGVWCVAIWWLHPTTEVISWGSARSAIAFYWRRRCWMMPWIIEESAHPRTWGSVATIWSSVSAFPLTWNNKVSCDAVVPSNVVTVCFHLLP